jgi:hypothetical protein
MFEARTLRYSHLRRLLDGYRVEQGMRQASGRELLPPTEGLRKALVESNKLKKEMVEDDPVAKELMGGLPQGGELEQAQQAQVAAERHDAGLTPDQAVSELADFGINPKSAPLMPGVTAWDESLPDL